MSDPPVHGIHRGMVVDDADPRGMGRLRVTVPSVTGTTSGWALVNLPLAAGEPALPAVGESVWVQYEAGDPHAPVVMGRLPG